MCSQSSGDWIVLNPHQWIGYSGSAHLGKRLQLWFKIPLCSINTASSVPLSWNRAHTVSLHLSLYSKRREYWVHSTIFFHCYKYWLWAPKVVNAALGWRAGPSVSRNSLRYCSTSSAPQIRPWRETWLIEITQWALESGMHAQASLILKFTHLSSPSSASDNNSGHKEWEVCTTRETLPYDLYFSIWL